MKQVLPHGVGIPLPTQPPAGIVQLPPPRTGPVAYPPAAAERRGVSPIMVATLTMASAVVGAVGATLLALAVGASTGAGIVAGSVAPPTTSELAILGAEPRAPAVAPAEMVVIDVSGAVAQPGLRTLEAGDRVGDAIAAAGGFAPRADLAETSRVVNLAQPLTDGMKILVPELGSATTPGENGQAGPADGLIDLNSAAQAELESLPGIGPVTAERIIAERATRPYDSVDDLRARDVVGASVFERIKDLIRAGA